MRTQQSLLGILLILLGLGQSAMAHSSHGPPIEPDQAIMTADSHLKAIVEAKMAVDGQALDRSWLKTKTEHRKLHRQGTGYYIVSIANPTVNQVLYMLLSNTGRYYATNFTGKFRGLDP